MKNRVKIHLNGNKTIYKYQKWAPELTPWYSWKKYSIKSATGAFNWEKWPAINDYTEYTYNKYPISSQYAQFQRSYRKLYPPNFNSKWVSDMKDTEYITYGHDLTTATKIPEHEIGYLARTDRCSETYVYSDGTVGEKIDKVKIEGWMAAMSQIELDNFICYNPKSMSTVGIKTTRGYERKARSSVTESTNLNNCSTESDKTSCVDYYNEAESRVNEATIDSGYLWNYIAYNSYLGKYDVEPTVLVSSVEPNGAYYTTVHYETPGLYFTQYDFYPDRKHGYGLMAQDQSYDDIPDPDNPETNYSVNIKRAWVDWKGGGVGNPNSYTPDLGVDAWCNAVAIQQGYSTNEQPVPHNPCSIIEAEAQISSENEKVQTLYDGVNHTGRMYTGVTIGSTGVANYMWGNRNDPYNEKYCNFYKQYQEGRYWLVTGDWVAGNTLYTYSPTKENYHLFTNDVKIYIFTPESYTDGEYLYNVYQLPVQVKNFTYGGNYTGVYSLPHFIKYSASSAVKNSNDSNNKFVKPATTFINGNPVVVTDRTERTNGLSADGTAFWEMTGEPQPHWVKDDSVASEMVSDEDALAYPQDGAQDGNWYTSVPVEMLPNEYIGIVWDNDNEAAYPEDGELDGYWYTAQGYEYEQHPSTLVGTEWSFTLNEYPNEDFKLGYWYKYIGQESVNELTLEDDKISTGITYQVNINPEKNLKYGTVAVASLTFAIPDNIAMGIYKNVRGQLIEAEIQSSRYSEWEKLGKFYLYSQKRNNSTVQYTCYDKLYDAVEYDFNPDDWGSIADMSYVEYLETLGDMIGVPVKTSTFSAIPNMSFKVFLPSEKCKYRAILEELGILNLCSFYMNENGELCMWREPTNSAILDKTKCQKMELGTEFQQYVKVVNGDTNYVGSASLDYTVPMTYTFDTKKSRPAETETEFVGKYLHGISYLPAKIQTDFDFLLKAGDAIYVAHPYETIIGENMGSYAKIIIFNKKIDKGIVTFECTGVSNYFD